MFYKPNTVVVILLSIYVREKTSFGSVNVSTAAESVHSRSQLIFFNGVIIFSNLYGCNSVVSMNDERRSRFFNDIPPF